MKNSRWMPLAFVALVAAALAVVAATAARDSHAAAANFKAGIVTDIGGLNDRGFNQMANQGRLRADRVRGISTRVLISKSGSDYIPNLTNLSRSGYGVVIGIGFLMGDAINTIARRFPKTKYAIVDFPWEGLKNKPKNVQGLLFKEQEAGYLVGYLAGLTVTRKPMGGNLVVGAVGGMKIPPVDRFIAGYGAGVRKANPRIKIMVGYSADFVNQAKCKEKALEQIANGANVIFQVAGGCGLGALQAAKEENVWGIGVDADQAYLGRHILTSALKKVDVAVYSAIVAAKNKGLRTGTNAIFSVKNGGVGYGKVSKRVPAADIRKLNAIRAQIAAGKIKIPTRVK